jgi:anthranilate phosphoribosyltransferase
LLKALLQDRAPAGLRDTVCLNAGAALWVAGKALHLKDGLAQAKDLLLGGKTKKWLDQAQAFFLDVKR